MSSLNKWLYTPTSDFLGLFLIPILSISLFFFKDLTTDANLNFGLAIINFVLSGGHNLGPTLYYLFSKQERLRIYQYQSKINYFIFFAFITPIVLISISYFFYRNDNQQMKVKLLATYGLLYLFWNTFHFIKQQLGILILFKSKNHAYENYGKNVDKLFVYFALGFIPVLAWYDFGIRFISLELIFNLPRKISLLSETSKNSLSLVLIAVTILIVLIHAKRKILSVPIFLSYLSILIQSLGILYMPLFYTLIIYSAAHWTQEIYLLGRYTQKDFKISLVTSTLFLILTSFLAYFLLSMKFWGENKIEVFGRISGFSNLSPMQYFAATVIVGTILGVNFVHFALDRYIHKRRLW